MVFSFKIPLPSESAASFQDSFGESKDPIRDVRSWVYQLLTKKGVEWSEMKRNGGFIFREVDKLGNPKSTQKPLKEINLEKWIPKSDPDYVPELLEDEDDIQFIEIKIGTSLFEKLSNLIAVNRHVAISFNRELVQFEKNRNTSTIENAELHKQQLKNQEKENKKFENFPIEEFLRAYIDRDITKRIQDHDKSLMEKEFDELYPEEDKKKKKKTTPIEPKKPIAGSRPKKKK